MKKKIIRLLNHRFIKGSFFLTAANFLVGFLNYFFNSLTGKVLGPSGYSEIVALFSYLFILSVPTQVVMGEIIRRLGQKGKKRLSVIRSWEIWYWQKIQHWSFLIIPYFLLLIWLPKFTNLTLESSISLLLILLFSFLAVFYTSTLLGLQLMFSYSLLVLLSTTIKLVGPILVFLKMGNIISVLILLIFSSAILSLAGKIFLSQVTKKIKPRIFRIEKRIYQIVFSKSILILFITAVSMNILNNLDVIYVKKNFPAMTAGLYGAWNLYGKIIYYVISPLLTTSYIFFSANEEKKNHLPMIAASIGLFAFFTLICTFFYWRFSDFVIYFIFNQKYLAIKPILPLAAIFGCAYCLISFFSGYFICKKSYKAIAILPFILVYPLLLIVFGKGVRQVAIINLVISLSILSVYFILIFFEGKKALNSNSIPFEGFSARS